MAGMPPRTTGSRSLLGVRVGEPSLVSAQRSSHGSKGIIERTDFRLPVSNGDGGHRPMAPGILLAIWLAPQIAGVTNSPCNGSVGAQTQIDSEVCLGNESLRCGETAPKGSTQHSELFEAAVAHYRRAATRANNSTEKSRALGLLATAYDAQHLNDLPQEEAALRELIATVPTELPPLFKLADVQELQGEIDAAEDTLLS